MMEKNIDMDLEDDPSKYFTDEEWKNLNYYEKVRVQNTYEIYVEMTKSGFVMEKPEFMMRTKEQEQPAVQPEMQKSVPNQRSTDNTEQKPKRTRRETRNDINSDNIKERYPKRNLPKKNYKEEEIIPDDHYIYCDNCMNEFIDKCAIHEPIYLVDNPVPLIPKNPNRARETVPQGWLNVSSSKIYNGGEGVWALRKIKMGVRFGPYEGTTTDGENDGEYSWQIKKDGKVVGYIDGQDTSKANWMRFVNCARNKTEQNLMGYQYRGKIYYRAIMDINPGTELLVFYGPQFARELGIDTKKFNSPPENPLKDNVFECKNCYLGFSSPIYLENHIARCNNKKSSTTDRKYNKKVRNENVPNNNNNESFKCHLCTMIYTIKSLYDRHLMIKHCIYDNNQETHAKSNEDLKKDDNSTSNDSGYNDELKHQGGSNKRRHKCSICHKAFTTAQNLEHHTRIHTGERPFQCETCQKSFTCATNLKHHKIIHTNERPHKCDLCNKTFNVKGNLIKHKRIHNNIRPYQCSECNKTFTHSTILDSHMRIHNGEKPYHCHMCQYKCTEAGHLKTHIRTHTGEKPYTCQYCNKSFISSSHLNSHKKTQHCNK